jgi:hypothetical protein
MNNSTKWDLIWKANVPPKVRIFAWRLAREALGIEQKRCKRTISVLPICSICGKEREDGFHAVVSCTKARALHDEIREVCGLSHRRSAFAYTCVNWLHVLLGSVDVRCHPIASTAVVLALLASPQRCDRCKR